MWTESSVGHKSMLLLPHCRQKHEYSKQHVSNESDVSLWRWSFLSDALGETQHKWGNSYRQPATRITASSSALFYALLRNLERRYVVHLTDVLLRHSYYGNGNVMWLKLCLFFHFLFTKHIGTSFTNRTVFSATPGLIKSCLFLADGLTTSRPAERESLLAVLLQRCHVFQKEVTK